MEPNRPDINNQRVETPSVVPVERAETPVERVEVPTPPSGPSVAAVPSQVAVTPAEGNLAAQYIAKELAQFRVALQRTQIFGSLLLLATLGYMGYLAYNFQQNLEPQTAAQIASGAISERVNDQADTFVDQMRERVPQLIAGLPDTVIKSLPGYRQQLETQINTDLTQHSKQAADNLSGQLDSYLDLHKDEMKSVLDSGNDSTAVKQMGAEIEQQFLDSLKKTDAGNGETVQNKLDKTLQSLHEIDTMMTKLAANKNLTPQEQKARHAIAIMAETANQGAPAVKQLVAQLQDTASQSVQQVADTANASAASTSAALANVSNAVSAPAPDTTSSAPVPALAPNSAPAAANRTVQPSGSANRNVPPAGAPNRNVPSPTSG